MADPIQDFSGGVYGQQATANAQPFKGVVVHVTGKPTLQDELDYMSHPDPNRPGQYGYHFLVDRDGTVYQTAPFDVRTNHIAPNSQFGLNNSNAIGVAFVGADKGTTPAQMNAGTQLVNNLETQFHIAPNMVVSHGELDPETRGPGHDLNPNGGAEGQDFINAFRGGAPSVAGAPARPGAPQAGSPSAQTIYQGLVARGFNPAQAAALTGNIQQESNFSTGANNPGEGAYGLIQWRLDRRDNLNAFAQAQGKPVNDLDTQLDFIKHEMGGSEAKNAAAFLAATDVASANAALHQYIRYGDNTEGQRLANAQAIASGKYPAGGGGGGVVAGGAAPQAAATPKPPDPMAMLGVSLGQDLASMSNSFSGGGGGGAQFVDPPDAPPIRAPALNADFMPPAANPVPANLAGGSGRNWVHSRSNRNRRPLLIPTPASPRARPA